MARLRYKTSDMEITTIKNIIKAFDQTDLHRILKGFRYFEGDHDIFMKQAPEGRPNHKLVTNFCKQIVETYAGYINLSASETTSEVIEETLDVLEECLTEALICGVGYVLYYFDDAQLSAVKLNPATTLILYDNSIADHIVGAITWNKYKTFDEGLSKEMVDLYVYDESTVTHYQGNTVDGVIEIDKQNHFMGTIPIVEVRATPDYKPLFECIYTLQDEYNYLMSVYEDSRETFNNAFLVISGMGVDRDSADDLIDGTNKILNLPLAEGKAYYLTKEDNPVTSTIPVLDQVRQDIFMVTSTPDFNNDKFSSASGMSIRMRLTAFVQKCQTIQQYFSKTIDRLGELLGEDPEFHFNSLVPVDLEQQVDSVVQLDGIISRRTQLANLPTIVEDVDEELKQIEEESNLEWLKHKDTVEDNGSNFQTTGQSQEENSQDK